MCVFTAYVLYSGFGKSTAARIYQTAEMEKMKGKDLIFTPIRKFKNKSLFVFGLKKFS